MKGAIVGSKNECRTHRWESLAEFIREGGKWGNEELYSNLNAEVLHQAEWKHC